MFEHISLFCSCEGRYCRGCDQIKCHRAFSKDATGKFGLSSRCKDCIREYQKSHIDQINAQRRKNRQEKAEQYNAYNREFHRKNPEPKKARDRKYRQEHAEEINAYLRNYTKTNEKYKEHLAEHRRQYNRLHPEINAQNLTIVALVYSRQTGHSPQKSGKTSVNSIIILVYVAVDRNLK